MSNHRLCRLSRISGIPLRGERQITQIIILAACCSLLITSIGCEAFVRKFTRKTKRRTAPEEMVLVPEEYKGPQMTKEEQYRQYFLFWRCWHDELLNSLSSGINHKKQINCAQEAIENLINLRALLNEYKREKLDVYIGQLRELKDSIAKDLYGSNIARNRRDGERIRRKIFREFSYNKVSEHISYGD